ncbi:MAG: hypothetical protein GX802_06350, partial [Clostridiales bacterium]|nr:hypothetical protein [Clostridiales bacterium]
MKKRIEFVVGRAKSGKSNYIYDRIVAHEQACEPVLLIAPGRFTFETEKTLAERLDGGAFYTKVLALSRLSEKVLSEVGIKQVFLSEQGRLMVIRKALIGLDLGIFSTCAHKTGFAKTCDEIIQGFINNQTEPFEVQAVAEKIQDPLLKRKLSDFASIYSKTSDLLGEKNIVPIENHKAFIDNIKNSSLCKAHVYIDGFESTGELMFRAIEEIVHSCASLTVSFSLDLSDNIRDSQLFSPDLVAYSRLKSYITDAGYDVKIISPTRENRYDNLELAVLEKELFAFPYKQFAGEVNNISLLAANNVDSEVNAVAGAIQKAVRDEGIRYNEIAVIASDESVYGVKVRSEFEKNSIPIFCDVQYSLYSMDVSNLTMSALRAVSGSYDKHELISIMKTGLCGISRFEAEVFENYLIEYGVFGSSLKEPLKKGSPELIQFLEPIRIKLIEPLIKLQNAMSRGDIAKKTRSIYGYLQDLDVQKKLTKKVDALQKENNFVQAEKCSQAWNLIMGIFDQLYAVMGDLSISNSHYISIIEEGMRAQVVSSIPSNIDVVLFGSMKRTIPKNIKRLFILGAYEGTFPKTIKDDSVIDDAELSALKDYGLKVWSSTASMTADERLELYTLLTLPTHRLYLSFPALVANKSKLPSMIFEKIKKIFPQLHVLSSSDERLEDYKLYNIERLACDLRLLADTGYMSESAKRLYAYYSDIQEKAEQLEVINKSIFFKASPNNLDADFAKVLYGENLYASATRLETFNTCSFYHFAKYGLNAKEQREYKIEDLDKGNFVHEILDKFVKHLLEKKIPYKEIESEKDCESILDELLPDIILNFKDGYFTESERRKANCDLLVKTAKRTAWAVIEHMKRGSFTFEKSELEFGKDKEYPALEIKLCDGRSFFISGKVDRVDSYINENNEKLIRVIDYKLSGRIFRYNELY